MKWSIWVGSAQHQKAEGHCPTTGRLGLKDDGTDRSVMRLKWVKHRATCSGVGWRHPGTGV